MYHLVIFVLPIGMLDNLQGQGLYSAFGLILSAFRGYLSGEYVVFG